MVYYDTNIWVSYMLGDRDDYYVYCKPLIDDIETGEKVAIGSYLVIMEAIHVLRQRIVEKREFTGGDRAECDKNIPVADSLVKKFMSKMKKLAEKQKIIIVGSNKTVDYHHHTTLGKLNDYFGYVRPVSICPYCKKGRVGREKQNTCPSCNSSPGSVNKYQYKALGHADIEHAYFARYNSVSIFCSADTSFHGLKNDPDFSPIKFQIIKHPDRFHGRS